ncbi:MAG: hypothetical protein U9N07_02755 [Euryarchaeota archaeon]|nr:hypothetical protein [Euryarchaeota archaeon]
MKKVVFGILIAVALMVSVIGSGCVGLGNSVDVGFLNGYYKQYDYVTSWDIIEMEMFLETLVYTVDLHFVHGKTVRLHRVVSIDTID